MYCSRTTGINTSFIASEKAELDKSESFVTAVAVKDGKFLQVGSDNAMKKLAGKSTRMVDLGGKTVVPGLIEACCHPMETVMLKEIWVDCRYPETASVAQAVEHIAAKK